MGGSCSLHIGFDVDTWDCGGGWEIDDPIWAGSRGSLIGLGLSSDGFINGLGFRVPVSLALDLVGAYFVHSQIGSDVVVRFSGLNEEMWWWRGRKNLTLKEYKKIKKKWNKE